MSSVMHPIIKQASGLPQVDREMAARQAVEWDAMVSQMQTLQPDDLTAEAVLRSASALLQSITTNYGPISGWSLAQNYIIYRHGCRIFGAGQTIISKPGWTESY